MSNNDKVEVIFGNKTFIDVTNETINGEIFSYYEAEFYGKTGVKIATSD